MTSKSALTLKKVRMEVSKKTQFLFLFAYFHISVFSSCNWTCMLLTLQWPGSFCIVRLYIYFSTIALVHDDTRLMLLRPSIKHVLTYFCMKSSNVNSYVNSYTIYVLPQSLNNKNICKIPQTVENWTIHGLW